MREDTNFKGSNLSCPSIYFLFHGLNIFELDGKITNASFHLIEIIHIVSMFHPCMTYCYYACFTPIESFHLIEIIHIVSMFHPCMTYCYYACFTPIASFHLIEIIHIVSMFHPYGQFPL